LAAPSDLVIASVGCVDVAMGDDGGCSLLADGVVDIGNAARRIVEMSTSLAKFLLVTRRMLFAHYDEVVDRNDVVFGHVDRASGEPKRSR
jgi:hypothetical protein